MAQPVGAKLNTSDLAGKRLTARKSVQVSPKTAGVIADTRGAMLAQQSLNIDIGQRENYREQTRIGHEIREREQMMRKARENFSYKKPMSGPGFYGVLLLVIAKDVLDIIIEIIELFADLTIILGIIVWCISTMLDLLVLASTQLYLYVNGVPMNKQKVMTQSVSTIIEFLPIAGFLPAGTVSFIIVRILANKEAKQKAIEALEEQEAVWQSEQDAAIARQRMLAGESASLANAQRATRNVIAFTPRNSMESKSPPLKQAA
ncbi:MAG TPA: hypothetical protein VJ579_01820 [Candidatus Paceibacterota bacterium]|nr:hypothetical protein [Candidatus Paceibacterota bacterium]